MIVSSIHITGIKHSNKNVSVFQFALFQFVQAQSGNDDEEESKETDALNKDSLHSFMEEFFKQV